MAPRAVCWLMATLMYLTLLPLHYKTFAVSQLIGDCVDLDSDPTFKPDWNSPALGHVKYSPLVAGLPSPFDSQMPETEGIFYFQADSAQNKLISRRATTETFQYIFIRYYAHHLSSPDGNSSYFIAPVPPAQADYQNRKHLVANTDYRWREIFVQVDVTGTNKRAAITVDGPTTAPGDFLFIDKIVYARGAEVNDIEEIKVLCPQYFTTAPPTTTESLTTSTDASSTGSSSVSSATLTSDSTTMSTESTSESSESTNSDTTTTPNYLSTPAFSSPTGSESSTVPPTSSSTYSSVTPSSSTSQSGPSSGSTPFEITTPSWSASSNLSSIVAMSSTVPIPSKEQSESSNTLLYALIGSGVLVAFLAGVILCFGFCARQRRRLRNRQLAHTSTRMPYNRYDVREDKRPYISSNTHPYYLNYEKSRYV